MRVALMSDQEDAGRADEAPGAAGGPGGLEVVIDRMSIPYLAGATIDFVDSLHGRGFVIDNPNAQGSCACGDSFH
jgi:iron-sulfur cluster assembly accessory protein